MWGYGDRLVWRLLTLIMLVGLAACTTTESTVSRDAESVRSGRFVVQVQGHDVQQAVSGGFEWQSFGPEHWQLSLRSPLGAVLARLNASPGMVVLQRPNEVPRRAERASDLLQSLFSAQVPVDAMAQWIEGRTSDVSETRIVRRHPQGQIEILEQDGWTVRLDRYNARGPRFMEMTGRDAGRDVTVRLIVDRE